MERASIESGHGVEMPGDRDAQAVLTEIFGEEFEGNQNIRKLLSHDPRELQSRALVLDGFFGDRWRIAPSLLYMHEGEIASRSEHLAGLTNNERWRRQPRLIHFRPDVLAERAEDLTALLGHKRWAEQPQLLGYNPETIREHANGLEEIVGRDSWKLHPSLLARTPETLRKHAQYLDELTGDGKWHKWPHLLGWKTETLRANANALEKLFGDRWKTQPQTLGLPPETINERAAFLDELCGGSKTWRHWPQLLNSNPDTLRKTASQLAELFGGSRWQLSPVLLSRSVDTLRRNAESHTREYGSDDWMRLVGLIGVTPRTFTASMRMLEAAGIDRSVDQTAFLYCLYTTTKTKREKCRLIREVALGHEHIYDAEGKVSLSSLGKQRRQLTEAQRAGEARELLELAQFVKRNPKTLTYSKSRIRTLYQSAEDNP